MRSCHVTGSSHISNPRRWFPGVSLLSNLEIRTRMSSSIRSTTLCVSKMVTSAGQTRLNPGLPSLESPHDLPKYRSARLGASIAGLGSPRKLRSLVSSPHYFTRLPLPFAPESQRQAPIRPMSGWSVARLSCRRYQIFLKKMPPLPNAFPHHVEPFP